MNYVKTCESISVYLCSIRGALKCLYYQPACSMGGLIVMLVRNICQTQATSSREWIR